MGRDIREHGADNGDAMTLVESLTKQCADESRNTLYTSTSFYIYLRRLRFRRAALWVIAGVSSTIAASAVVAEFSMNPVLVAGLTLAGVVLPGIVKATKLDEKIEAYEKQAAAFKKAEAHLERAAKVWSKKAVEEFEIEARSAQELLDTARSVSLTPPEWAFKAAKLKIQSGDYDPDERGKRKGFWRRIKWCVIGR